MFSQAAKDWDARYLATESMWSLEPNQFVVEALSDLPAGSMLDLAGGEGRNALWFASRGWNVENVEFSRIALDKFLARAQELENQKRVIASHFDATTAVFELRPDLTVIAYLQLPWDQLELALDNVLAQQTTGVVFGVWHSIRNLTEGYGGPPFKEMLPSPLQLKSWAQDKGLNFEVRERNRLVDTGSGFKTALDVTLLVRL
jgi:SAM-dependent methyltransferase